MARADPQLVLIGGAQRSGTTLLQTLVANALGAANLPEAHILCDLLAAYKRAKASPKKTRYFYSTDNALLGFYQSCGTRHLADIADHLGHAEVLVLKDPHFVELDAEAAAIFPGAIRIAILRDPRDIAASYLSIGQRQSPDGRASKYRRRDIHFIGQKILSSYAALMREPRSGAYLIRYEDVASEPHATLERLGRDTGLSLSLAKVDRPTWLESDSRHDEAWISELEDGGPSAKNIGSYKTALSSREIGLIETICGQVLAWGGYSRSINRAQPLDACEKFARSAFNRMRNLYWSHLARLR